MEFFCIINKNNISRRKRRDDDTNILHEHVKIGKQDVFLMKYYEFFKKKEKNVKFFMFLSFLCLHIWC